MGLTDTCGAAAADFSAATCAAFFSAALSGSGSSVSSSLSSARIFASLRPPRPLGGIPSRCRGPRTERGQPYQRYQLHMSRLCRVRILNPAPA